MEHVHQPIKLDGRDWPECRLVVGYEIDRNSQNWHNLRERCNAFFLQEEVRQREESDRRNEEIRHFHDKCDRMEASRESDNKAHDGLVSALNLRLGLLEGKVINYTSITAVVVSIVTTLIMAWVSKKM